MAKKIAKEPKAAKPLKTTLKPVKKAAPAVKAAKVVEKAAAPAAKCATDVKAENLKKFAKSTMAANFVKAHSACWNHQDWLNFVADVKAKGYDPIDFDQVGLILEDKKAKFLAK